MNEFETMDLVADLHCDLLCYLANPAHTALDAKARCSLPQLQAGGVRLQTLAVFTETGPNSVSGALNQLEAYKKLLIEFPHAIYAFDGAVDEKRIGCTLAIENASGLLAEEEPLDLLFKRLDCVRAAGNLAYVSLTWNTANRFGGGALEPGKLTKDGKHLLEYLNHCRIATDVSHASDLLAKDILDHADKVIASHSNFRQVADQPRNLPDWLAKGIAAKGGVIGINFYRLFVGAESALNFSRQLEYALNVVPLEAVCLGADFFYDDDLPPERRKSPDDLFFPEAAHAAIAYPFVIGQWRRLLLLSDAKLHAICFDNAKKFLCDIIPRK